MSRFRSISFSHGQEEKIGVLITNLGSPEAPTAKALRPYLRQFLSDPRVVEFPRLLWWLVLNGVILRIRPRRSARSYKTVWTDEGSPLCVYTQKQSEALAKKLKEKWGDKVIVDWAMRYGQPSISDKIHSLQERGVTKLVVLPLYPQYSGATSGSTFDAIAEDFCQRRWLPELRFINHYCDYPPYIEALAKSIREHWKSHGRADKLIFSYHGVPMRYLHKGDPYHCHCHKTSRLLADALELSENDYLTTFQSRFGREEWLKPYTDMTLKSLPEKNVKSVEVVCPGFSSDCLETIEEIGEENREYFLSAGGENFSYIPALNDSDNHIDALAQLIESNINGWQVSSEEERSLQSKRALSHKDNRQNN